jgi:hypothetical protein
MCTTEPMPERYGLDIDDHGQLEAGPPWVNWGHFAPGRVNGHALFRRTEGKIRGQLTQRLTFIFRIFGTVDAHSEITLNPIVW